MKKIIYIIVVAVLLPIMNSCDFLDVVPDNLATIEQVFRDRNTAQKYLYTCYSFMPAHNNSMSNPGNMLSDEFAIDKTMSGVNKTLTETGNNPNNPQLNFWDGSKSLWAGIRTCNIMLEQVDNIPDITEEEALRWKAEAKFLKAYYHWYLLSLYGPIPIVDKNLSIDASDEEMQVYREPVDKVIDYIVSTIDAALPDLPMSIVGSEATEFGRVTRVAALSIKARILTTAASALYNGNNDYSKFVDKRGIHLFATGAPKIEKWQRAIDACKEAIDACTTVGLGLYHFQRPPGLEKIMKDSIVMVCQPAMILADNLNTNEVIWFQSNAKGAQTNCIPQAIYSGIASSDVYYGASNVYPRENASLNAAELFYSKNGVPIEEDLEWHDNGWFENRFKSDPNFATRTDHRYYIKKEYQTSIFHLNRESRYYGSLGFDGCNWFGFGNVDQENQYFVKDFNNFNLYPAMSGFYIRKFCPYRTAMEAKSPKVLTNSMSYHNYYFPIMRVADLYLLYAEALNEVDPTNADIIKYVDLIRARAGLKGVVETWSTYATDEFKTKYSDQAGMREIIRRERMIELAFEGQGGFDRRRWKIMDKLLTKGTIRGFASNKGEALAEFHTPDVLWATDFKMRDYFWPIKTSSLQANPNLIQNPGW